MRDEKHGQDSSRRDEGGVECVLGLECKCEHSTILQDQRGLMIYFPLSQCLTRGVETRWAGRLGKTLYLDVVSQLPLQGVMVMTILPKTCDLYYHLFHDQCIVDLNRRFVCEVVGGWCSSSLWFVPDLRREQSS
jgi:hypothetical protein